MHRLEVPSGLIYERALDGNVKQIQPALPTYSQAGQHSGESRACAVMHQPQKEHVVCLHRASVTVKARLCHHGLCTDDQGAEGHCKDSGDICAIACVNSPCPLHSPTLLLDTQPPAAPRLSVFTCAPFVYKVECLVPEPRGTAPSWRS